MLIIGSRALQFWGLCPPGREVKDTDIIASWEEFKTWIQPDYNYHQPIDDRHWVCRAKDGTITEVEIAWPGTAAEALNKAALINSPNKRFISATPTQCLALKLSHRFLRNSPHFHKTRNDILWLRKQGIELTTWLKAWLLWREKETYTYEHPKLNQSKNDFFQDDGIVYKYDHDSLHEAVALGERPAYLEYIRPGAEVECDMSIFNALPYAKKVVAVYEEAAVLALERALIPHPKKWNSSRDAFEFALQKVATSITSGSFRSFAWEAFDDVMRLAKEHDFFKSFALGLHNGIVVEK